MMKKRVLIFLLAFVVILILGLVFKNFISPPIAETPAPVQKASVNITVIADNTPPDLIVYSPTNTDYSTNQIDIKYSVSDSSSGVDMAWYNIDGGQNTTLTGNKAITVSKGQHTLYIYASDNVGLVNDSEFVIFSVK